jgi:phosphatidylserine synthase
MNQLIQLLLVLAAVLYVVSGLSRFLKFQIMGHDPTVWFRGSMGLLGFSIALMLWQILQRM